MIPLYIGVELILGAAILNKAGGAYGILSIFLGHPINFWQWLYHFLAILVLPFYISALKNLQNRANNIRKLSLACLIYVADTAIGVLYTVYFIHFWFSREDTNPAEVPGSVHARDSSDYGASTASLSSQSATPARELFFTTSGVLIVTTVRLYATLVFLSFTKALLKQDTTNSHEDYAAEGDGILGGSGYAQAIKKFVYGLEIRSKEILSDFFTK